jgi:DinB superfamily
VSQELDSIIANLGKTQTALLSAADEVSGEQWKTRPSQDCWSAAELVAHLMMVERGVIGKADRVAQHAPKPVSLLKRIHLPVKLVERRLIRIKTPVPVEPGMLRDKEEMLAEVRTVRERSIAFLEETRSRNMSGYIWKHPALGMLNAYEWMQFISAHEVRHTKQMREIAAALPKAIESLQK